VLPVLITAWIGFSTLAFVPVPWPDDSAFYFVGRELFKWPPRWVMLPQAPFEPTYRIFNFNTMPLYPILIGLGRLIGIDGSHAIKFWPLAAFGLSASLLAAWIFRAGLPAWGALSLSLVIALDPEMRWASVLVRPESLIGLAGLALVLGLSIGFPARFKARGLWHPVSALLAIAAYAHFNAIHLLFAVMPLYLARPRELFSIGIRTALYLSPWLIVVLLQIKLFVYQMTVQWTRLAVHNTWLDSPIVMLQGLFQDMGSPEPWPDSLLISAALIWVLMLAAAVFGLLWPASAWTRGAWERWKASNSAKNAFYGDAASAAISLVPSSGWVVGACWLWYTKPEVWFVYYIHLAVWTFAGIAALKLWKARSGRLRTLGITALGAGVLFNVGLYGWVDVTQARRLAQTQSWSWDVFKDWVDCVDDELMRVEARLGFPKPFRVWDPTFPDITIELSRRHPEWEFTRTNDFHERIPLAVQHGHDVEAVVVTETVNWSERTISAPQNAHPEILSVWMTWKDHYLNRLWETPGWKPNRYLCQRGRWMAFIFEK
jgi:hypothetical protein